MRDRIKTCATCPNLEYESLGSTRVFGCRLTGEMTPHATTPGVATFWRVPTECPRPDTDVDKRETRALRCEWEELQYEN